jgi:YesN/AraC family two-component response regulator
LSVDDHIDLLITDVQMPDMNGLELIGEASALSRKFVA